MKLKNVTEENEKLMTKHQYATMLDIQAKKSQMLMQISRIPRKLDLRLASHNSRINEEFGEIKMMPKTMSVLAKLTY